MPAAAVAHERRRRRPRDDTQAVRGLLSLPRTARRPLASLLLRLRSPDAKLLAFAVSPEVRAQPWDLYKQLRETHPVYRTRLGAWIVVRHADVATLARHPHVGVDETKSTASPRPTPGAFSELTRRLMLFLDPPDHERLRRLVVRAFTPARVRELRPRAELLAHRRLEAIFDRGEADLLADLAYPFPIDVICELLGIPVADRAAFPGWARAFAARLDVQPMRTPAIERAGNTAASEFIAYFNSVISDAARRTPGGLIDALVTAEEEGDRLTRDEVIATCALLLMAGHETTANLVGNGLLSLFDNPAQLHELRVGTVPMEHAVEELLRHDGPAQLTQRVALTDLEVGGHTIPAGDLIVLLLGAANRDPAVFDDPEQLNLARSPNPHLAFSSGIHACLGASLARMEAEILIRGVLERLPGLRCAARPQWRETFVLRGLHSLPVAWTP
jgi:cytochrome P450